MSKNEILVNELAPRPHNSGHFSIEACESSQFQQHIRAIFNLDLGETPNIWITSWCSSDDGAGVVTAPSGSKPVYINGVDSAASPTTMTTNYTAKTFILCEDSSNVPGVNWVCIG
mgnify:CR=1 FL=1